VGLFPPSLSGGLQRRLRRRASDGNELWIIRLVLLVWLGREVRMRCWLGEQEVVQLQELMFTGGRSGQSFQCLELCFACCLVLLSPPCRLVQAEKGWKGSLGSVSTRRGAIVKALVQRDIKGPGGTHSGGKGQSSAGNCEVPGGQEADSRFCFGDCCGVTR
jgi:hypothetical protein